MSSASSENTYIKLEPILDRRNHCFVIYPIEYPDIWDFYKQAQASFWTPEEIDLSHDKRQWPALNSDECLFLSCVLAFFAASDVIVTNNLCFYSFQMAMESIHLETYSLLIDNLIEDKAIKETRAHLNAIESFPSIRRKADWAFKWINDHNSPFSCCLVAFAAIKGIFFSSSFAAIFWMKKRGLLPGLNFSNDLISCDEGMHTEFACMLYKKIQHKPSKTEIQSIIASAVEIEHKFLEDTLTVKMIGMNADLTKQYIEFIADHLLIAINIPPLYKSRNPFDFMDLISLEGKSNFFERRVAEYAKSGLNGPSRSRGPL
ncbi:ferritin-like superfamily [Panaeolus papilionaceus]|nr:ferritin-like superfamily [Panaeolus papilionaceus]